MVIQEIEPALAPASRLACDAHSERKSHIALLQEFSERLETIAGGESLRVFARARRKSRLHLEIIHSANTLLQY